jgi:hypothetical protein
MARLGTAIFFSRFHTLIRDVARIDFIRRYIESIRVIGSRVAVYFVFY